jgi:hypothetical protein
MYQASIPTFIRHLNILVDILTKGATHAEAKKIDPTVFINSRLAPDMFALAKQVQIVSDTCKGAAGRLAQVQPPSYEDTETTFSQLIERAKKTIAFLETLKPEQIDGGEERVVSWKTRTAEKSMKGQPYLFQHALPNLFFHVSMVYAILRHNGVELGKGDYLGKL